MKRKIALIALFSFIFFTIAIIFSVVLAYYYFHSPGSLQSNKTIIIKNGQSLTSIAKQLNNENILSQPKLFKNIVRIINRNNQLKSGEYLFNANSTPYNIYTKLKNADVVTHKLTIAEGLSTAQILVIIDNIDILKGQLPSDIKEGELLPETYDYYYGEQKKDLINRMKKLMQQNLDHLWSNRDKNILIETKDEAITLASIVEKETGIAEERGKVASVFYNRLKKNMRLQSDPTVHYAITKGEYILPRPLYRKDLQIDSAYNTYKIFGLPPTPIANPGVDSIKAVLNPPDTNNYYFVADGSGGHKFAKTLKEHNKNVASWKRFKKNNKIK